MTYINKAFTFLFYKHAEYYLAPQNIIGINNTD